MKKVGIFDRFLFGRKYLGKSMSKIKKSNGELEKIYD